MQRWFIYHAHKKAPLGYNQWRAVRLVAGEAQNQNMNSTEIIPHLIGSS